MALLTTGEFYNATFSSPTSVEWIALPSPRPGYKQGPLSDAISDGTSLVFYVTDSASGMFSYRGGAADGFDDTIVAPSGAPLDKIFLNDADGIASTWAKDASNNVYFLNTATGMLQQYSGAGLAAFKAWLP